MVRASDNYGLAGTVSRTSTDAYSVLAGPKREDGRQEIKRVQVFYETTPNGGSFSVEMVDRKETKNTKSSERTEGYMEVSSGGGRQVTLQAHGDGDVTIYGVALENNQTGVTWETFGVAGSSVQSMENRSKATYTHKLCIEILHSLFIGQVGTSWVIPLCVLARQGVQKSISRHSTKTSIRCTNNMFVDWTSGSSNQRTW